MTLPDLRVPRTRRDLAAWEVPALLYVLDAPLGVIVEAETQQPWDFPALRAAIQFRDENYLFLRDHHERQEWGEHYRWFPHGLLLETQVAVSVLALRGFPLKTLRHRALTFWELCFGELFVPSRSDATRIYGRARDILRILRTDMSDRLGTDAFDRGLDVQFAAKWVRRFSLDDLELMLAAGCTADEFRATYKARVLPDRAGLEMLAALVGSSAGSLV